MVDLTIAQRSAAARDRIRDTSAIARDRSIEFSGRYDSSCAAWSSSCCAACADFDDFGEGGAVAVAGGTFAVPAEHQQRVLTIGIGAALVLRAAFIAIGAALLDAFSVMLLLFGILLIVTGVQLFRHRDEDPSVDDNLLVVAARRSLPTIRSSHRGTSRHTVTHRPRHGPTCGWRRSA